MMRTFESCKLEETVDDKTKKHVNFIIKCFICQEEGHKAAYCPNKNSPSQHQQGETSQSRNVKICDFCKMTNHTEESCFKKARMKKESTHETFNVDSTFYIVEEQNSKEEEICTRQTKMKMDMQIGIQIIMGTKVVSRKALWDTGSAVSMINESFVPKGVDFLRCFKKINGVNSLPIIVKGSVTSSVIINEELFSITWIVVEDGTLNCECLIGRDFMEYNNLKVQIMNKNDKILLTGGIEEKSDLEVDNSTLTKKEKEIFKENDVLYEKLKQPMAEKIIKIELKSNKEIQIIPECNNVFVQKELNKVVEKVLGKNIINSKTIAQKKNDDYRMCINSFQLNKIVEGNYFPKPIIEDRLVKVKNRMSLKEKLLEKECN